MRTVVPSDEVATMWARQSQPRATNQQRNFYFQGDTIFSYGSHFPIARHVEHSGRKCILFTTATWSNTTARHISETSFAASEPGVPVFHVPELRPKSPNGFDRHMENRSSYLDRLRNLAVKAKRARTSRDWHADSFADLLKEARAYARFFGLRWRLNRGASVQLELFAARALRAERRAKSRGAKAMAANKLAREQAHRAKSLPTQSTLFPET